METLHHGKRSSDGLSEVFMDRSFFSLGLEACFLGIWGPLVRGDRRHHVRSLLIIPSSPAQTEFVGV